MSPRRLIVIDPGHGGHDSGTFFGTQTEKAANLAIALTLKAQLEAVGYTVELTRSGDIYPSWPERTHPRGEALFVAVHFNMPGSYPCMYYQIRGGPSLGFASQLAAACGIQKGRVWVSSKSRFKRLYIDDVRAPAILWEVDAIDKYVDSKAYRLERVAPVVRAIRAWLER